MNGCSLRSASESSSTVEQSPPLFSRVCTNNSVQALRFIAHSACTPMVKTHIVRFNFRGQLSANGYTKGGVKITPLGVIVSPPVAVRARHFSTTNKHVGQCPGCLLYRLQMPSEIMQVRSCSKYARHHYSRLSPGRHSFSGEKYNESRRHYDVEMDIFDEITTTRERGACYPCCRAMRENCSKRRYGRYQFLGSLKWPMMILQISVRFYKNIKSSL